jgi:SAM-dependent methyltransferase
MASAMRRFWDRRAREDAFFFVDSRLEYGNPDLDWFWEEGERALDKLILGRLGARIEPDDDVVEIGCGVGRITRPIARRARSVRALDVSPRMLELAREHNPGLASVEWIESDGTTLEPVADASADVCISYVVFQHIPDPEITYGYVREMGRVLRPGGWAAFQLSDDAAVHRRRGPIEAAKAVLAGIARRAPRGWTRPEYRGSAVDLDALRAAADDGGLDVERIEGAGTQYCMVLARRRGDRG